jgi:hypothetical protein
MRDIGPQFRVAVDFKGVFLIASTPKLRHKNPHTVAQRAADSLKQQSG